MPSMHSEETVTGKMQCNNYNLSKNKEIGNENTKEYAIN